MALEYVNRAGSLIGAGVIQVMKKFTVKNVTRERFFQMKCYRRSRFCKNSKLETCRRHSASVAWVTYFGIEAGSFSKKLSTTEPNSMFEDMIEEAKATGSSPKRSSPVRGYSSPFARSQAPALGLREPQLSPSLPFAESLSLSDLSSVPETEPLRLADLQPNGTEPPPPLAPVCDQQRRSSPSPPLFRPSSTPCSRHLLDDDAGSKVKDSVLSYTLLAVNKL
ncbi:hypothetical protein M5K25_024872 [Dendrobium thyrsiflorum]|uniref:Uncharacterized protein n=1 Tax=Dendrobium thyrsiflorum TaxID=117978 RepID=A0ABD0U7R5_DENTH